MHQNNIRFGAVISILCLTVLMAAPLAATESSALEEAGSKYNPYDGYTATVSNSADIYVYKGTCIDVTFQPEEDFEETCLTLVQGSGSLSVDGLRMYGTLTADTVEAEVEGLFEEELYSSCTLTIHAVDAQSINGGYVGTAYSYMIGDGYTDRGAKLSGGQMPPGLSIDVAGNITGTPTAGGTYRFTIAIINVQVKSAMHFCIDIEEITTVTETSVSTKYVVEGESFTFRVNGSVENGDEYSAVVTATGGTVTPETVGDGNTVTYTAPTVSGKTTFTITVTSNVEGCVQSQAKITVYVVDKLAVSTPVVGTISSS